MFILVFFLDFGLVLIEDFDVTAVELLLQLMDNLSSRSWCFWVAPKDLELSTR